jgi:DNA-binding protein H-NS
LEHVEQSQQRKNDDKYKKILQEMRKDEITSEELLKKLKNAGGGANSRAIGA